jgi:hypothetical protein
MESREVLIGDGMEQDELETGEKEEERSFKAGELVEFWEGTKRRGTGQIAGNQRG